MSDEDFDDSEIEAEIYRINYHNNHENEAVSDISQDEWLSLVDMYLYLFTVETGKRIKKFETKTICSNQPI